MEDLGNRLNLGIIKGVLAGIGIHAKSVDRALVASVQSRRRVGRVGDEGVDRVGHLVAQDRELVHLHLRLVLSIDRLVTDQASSCDHVGGHTITNKHDDVLGFALLCKVADKPGSLGRAAIVVVERRRIFSRLVQGQPAVGLCADVYYCVPLGVASEEV